jgi:hypothetical protein
MELILKKENFIGNLLEESITSVAEPLESAVVFNTSKGSATRKHKTPKFLEGIMMRRLKLILVFRKDCSTKNVTTESKFSHPNDAPAD